MDEFDKNPIDYLRDKLNSKARLKQRIWKNTLKFFAGLRQEGEKVIEGFKDIGENDDGIPIAFNSMNEFEFHIHFGSDMVVFGLQTNIVTFDSSHYLMQNKYIQQSPDMNFFGQILIYDFMADSMRYNRTQDTGYLLGRILVNFENHFMIEGVRGLHYLFDGIDKTEGSEEKYSLIIKKALAVAVDSDLLAPEFSQIQFVTLGVRMKGDQEIGHGKKIGFQMSDDNSTPKDTP